MRTALVTLKDAREMRWIAGWASTIRELVMDPTLIIKIKADIARPSVQKCLREIRNRERELMREIL